MLQISSLLLNCLLASIFIHEALCIVCTKEEIFGDTRPLICPGPNDSKDKVYCCGPKKLRYCCSYADYSSAINTIGIIVGVLVIAIVVVVIIVVVSCFCCSCCLLAKRRNRRGNAYSAGQQATTTTTTTVHYPPQPAYPVHTFPTAYTAQQQYQPQYPQQQFMQEHFQQQYPPNPYQQSAPYPSSGYQGGYPPPAGNPPPYPVSDQPAYNPSFPPSSQ